jgi:hypothetical protein
VIIGRSTEEAAVDIDLTRAGEYTHNISRRQVRCLRNIEWLILLMNFMSFKIHTFLFSGETG